MYDQSSLSFTHMFMFANNALLGVGLGLGLGFGLENKDKKNDQRHY